MKESGMANRLAGESSPYLKKHAGNPVDWRPWGPEAFALALKEDRPVFLSSGYTACHWCNVMEEESFSDPEAAALLNESFVCVKVDREERPDVDHLYMAFCHMMTGSGGWPLTVIMTPDKRPFFAGTYIPKRSAYGRSGLMDLIPRVAAMWRDHRAEVAASAGRMFEALARDGAVEGGAGDINALARAARAELAEGYDESYGGFGAAPKFPTPHVLMFLARYGWIHGDREAVEMAAATLRAMRLGGIYDHLGMGFHRYSTDRQWLVPHFEKMLYDQALIALAAVEVCHTTGDDFYGKIARACITFALENLKAPSGGFFASLGADSEGREGRFYLWKRSGIVELLSARHSEAICGVFNIEEQGNFIDPAEGERTGDNILYLKWPVEEAAVRARVEYSELLDAVGALYVARETREHPELDDKVLTDLGGMMVAALARAGAAFGLDGYLKEARRAAEFYLSAMRPGGRLLHARRGAMEPIAANADDYAFLAWGLLELCAATKEHRWLDAAVSVMDEFVARHWDDDEGAFYFAGPEADIPLRRKEWYDGATPSANAVALHSLRTLAAQMTDPKYGKLVSRLTEAGARHAAASPSAHAHFILAAIIDLNSTAR